MERKAQGTRERMDQDMDKSPQEKWRVKRGNRNKNGEQEKKHTE